MERCCQDKCRCVKIGSVTAEQLVTFCFSGVGGGGDICRVICVSNPTLGYFRLSCGLVGIWTTVKIPSNENLDTIVHNILITKLAI